jgi:Basic region leucine zipper
MFFVNKHISRERNRMHAKMTRDRKKSYLATIETTIATLERDNQRMREVLAKLSRTTTHDKYPSKDLCLNDSPSFTIGNFEESQVERTFSESPNTNVQPICG